jgi:hypothetical protein
MFPNQFHSLGFYVPKDPLKVTIWSANGLPSMEGQFEDVRIQTKNLSIWKIMGRSIKTKSWTYKAKWDVEWNCKGRGFLGFLGFSLVPPTKIFLICSKVHISCGNQSIYRRW